MMFYTPPMSEMAISLLLWEVFSYDVIAYILCTPCLNYLSFMSTIHKFGDVMVSYRFCMLCLHLCSTSYLLLPGHSNIGTLYLVSYSLVLDPVYL